MTQTIEYTVPDLSCSHCEAAVTGELTGVTGVQSVSVDLGQKRVVVTGDGLSDAELRAAIEEAGYRAE